MTVSDLDKYRQYAEYAKGYTERCESMEAGDAARLAMYAQAPLDEIERLTAEWSGWISVDDKLPPDCSSYAIRSMHMICNDGFVTIGFWYPKAKEWHDAGRDGGYDITSQVTHWAKMPTAPVAVSGSPSPECLHEYADPITLRCRDCGENLPGTPVDGRQEQNDG